VRGLLARPPGWVPPPEPGGVEEPLPTPTDLGDDGLGDDGLGDDGLGDDGLGDDGLGDDGLRDLQASWSPRAHHEPAGLRPGRLASFLPVAVATGRLDPGRRGAAALVVVALLGAVVAGGVVLRGRPEEVLVPEVLSSGAPLPGTTAAAPSGTPPAPDGEVVVAVAGKVVRPGLVRLPVGSRVDDALQAAGGPLDVAALGLLNLARVLVDGEQVLVGVDPSPGAPQAAGQGPTSGGLLDLNAASASDFEDLPGIGPVLAQRIVDWRTDNGPFASVDQLREVSGIGEATFADLRSKVVV